MDISIGGVKHKIWVKQGPEGVKEFQKKIEEMVVQSGFAPGTQYDVRFACDSWVGEGAPWHVPAATR
jgi:hypothetical protein